MKATRDIANALVPGPVVTAITTLYVGATLAVNAAFYASQLTFEAIERANTRTYIATLDDSRLYSGPISSANVHLWVGNATDAEGNSHSLSDTIRLLEGKFRANSVLPDLQPGSEYKFTAVDSILGEVVLSAENIK